MKNTFTTQKENIDNLVDDDSDLNSSDSDDSSGNSHFQFHNKPKSFAGPKKSNTYPEDYVNIPGVNTQTGVVLQQAYEYWNIKLLFNKSHDKSIKLEFGNVILLDSQYTMDLFYNPKFVGNIYKAKKICAIILTEEGCSSLTMNMYLVTSHMYGLTKNVSLTSFPSRISLSSIVSPTIS